MTDQTPTLEAGDLARVADSFALAHAEAATVGRLFYETLFKRAPHLRPLFGDDFDTKGIKMMDTLHLIVATLGHLNVVRPVIEDLARQHVAYGVQPKHYAEVGSTLIVTLAEFLGPDRFNLEVSAAWQRAYDVLSDIMISSAYPEMAA